MALTHEESQEAVRLIHAAAYDPGEWQGALAMAARAGGGWGGQLLGISGSRGLIFNYAVGLSSDAFADFERFGGADPTVNPRAMAMLANGPTRNAAARVLVDDDFISADGRRRNGFYQDVLKRHDAPNMTIAVLNAPKDLSNAIAIVRSKGQGVATTEDIASLAALAPAVNAAIRLQGQLEDQGALIAMGALDRVSLSAFVCDVWGRITAFTKTAEAMLASGAFLRAAGGRLVAASQGSDLDLQAAMSKAAHWLSMHSASSTAVILRDAGGLIRIADVAPLPLHRHSFRMGGVVMVSLRENRQRPQAAELLRRAHGLTVSETAVAMALALGQSTTTIAQMRGVSRETIRNQIKSLFSKIGVDSQSNLIRAVALIIGGLES